MREYFKDTFVLRWSELDVHAIARCLIAPVVLMATTVSFGKPSVGIFCVISAFLVGNGSLRQLSRFRAMPMIFASLGMAFCALVGSLLGSSSTASVTGLAVFGFFYGVSSSLGPGVSWVGLASLVSYVVLGAAYPAWGQAAIVRGIIVLGGGLAQTATITALWHWKRVHSPREIWIGPGDFSLVLNGMARALLENVKFRSEVFKFGARVSLTLVAGELLSKSFLTARSYWAVMTIALIVQPDFRNTLTRGLQRCAGTLIGAGFATFIAAVLRPSPPILFVLIAACLVACYVFFNVNYAIYTGFITSFVVFLLGLSGLPAIPLIKYRVVATLLGGALSLVAYLRLPKLVHGPSSHLNAEKPEQS